MSAATLTKWANAVRVKRAAQENCVHWDYEGGTGDHQCCRELRQAQVEATLAHAAHRRANFAAQRALEQAGKKVAR